MSFESIKLQLLCAYTGTSLFIRLTFLYTKVVQFVMSLALSMIKVCMVSAIKCAWFQQY